MRALSSVRYAPSNDPPNHPTTHLATHPTTYLPQPTHPTLPTNHPPNHTHPTQQSINSPNHPTTRRFTFHQVIHSDLKARNVLLKTDARSGRGAVAKVADFGLAVRIDVFSTHVSEFHGTLSHMAPETQLKRRVTKASDVYSFGITLWEL